MAEVEVGTMWHDTTTTAMPSGCCTTKTFREPKVTVHPQRAFDRLLATKKHVDVWETNDDKICVSLRGCEISEGVFLVGVYGIGSSLEYACEDFLRKVQGKKVVFNACSSERETVIFL